MSSSMSSPAAPLLSPRSPRPAWAPRSRGTRRVAPSSTTGRRDAQPDLPLGGTDRDRMVDLALAHRRRAGSTGASAVRRDGVGRCIRANAISPRADIASWLPAAGLEDGSQPRPSAVDEPPPGSAGRGRSRFGTGAPRQRRRPAPGSPAGQPGSGAGPGHTTSAAAPPPAGRAPRSRRCNTRTTLRGESVRCAGDQVFDEPLQRIVAGGGRGPDVTFEPAGVRQQMTDSDNRAGPLDRRFGSLAGTDPHRNVQLDKPLIHQLHDQRCGPHLGDRLDHEQRIWCGLDPRPQVDHTGRGLQRLTIDERRDRRPRNVVRGNQAWQLRVQPAAQFLDPTHPSSRAWARAAEDATTTVRHQPRKRAGHQPCRR